ncbi:MAG: protein-disulfide reductase DsbD [Lysobacterales bacterium]
MKNIKANQTGPVAGALWAIALLSALLTAGISNAVDEADLLPVAEAFAPSADFVAGDELRVRWQVAEGYYLYKSRLSVTTSTPGVVLGEPVLPKGKEKDDEFFGLQETYRGVIDVFVPVSAGASQAIELELRSQGCADLGVCYPPQKTLLTVTAPAGTAAITNTPLSVSTGIVGGTASSGLFGANSITALGADSALPVDQAFVFETIAIASDALLARWTIADGYYLYRDQIQLTLSPSDLASLSGVNLPPGEAKFDEHFGDTTVYYGQVEIPIELSRHGADAGVVNVTANYQGCKEAGICYPPVTRTVAVAVPQFSGGLSDALNGGNVQASATVSPAQSGVAIPEQDRLAAALGSEKWLTLLTFFGFGLLLSFTPCVFPMIPILSGIIAGQGKTITTRRAFTLSLVYVLAMALTYTVAGVVAGLFGENLQAWFQKSWVLVSFAGLFVLLSFSMFGFYELNLPSAVQTRLNRVSDKQEGGTLLGTGIMGILSALIVGPCVAPPLAAALIYIGQTGDALLGGLALFFLALGMGVPLLIIGTSAGKLLPHAGPWMNAIKAVFGVALLALAIWMLERVLAPGWIMLAWGALLVASAVYLGAFERLLDGANGWAKLWKSLGVLLAIVGAMELTGAAAGGQDWMQPLKGVFGSNAVSAAQPAQFTKIKSLDDLESALASTNQPMMLDFYADWCVDCKRMDKYSFPTPQVRAAMADGGALKADVTANDEVDQALMKAFNIIGPPAILFFSAKGEELPQYRVVGYQRPDVFAAHVTQAFAAQ